MICFKLSFLKLKWKYWNSSTFNKVERLPVTAVESGSGMQKLLAVPSIPNSKGESVATAVFDTFEEWNLADKAQAMGFDTTESNTDPAACTGACRTLQDMIGHDLLLLVCRHHDYEIMKRSAFESELWSRKIEISRGRHFQTMPERSTFRKNWCHAIRVRTQMAIIFLDGVVNHAVNSFARLVPIIFKQVSFIVIKLNEGYRL